MAKRQSTPDIPAECCGVCKFSHNMGQDLVCYVASPVLLPDENGVISAHRGVEVFPQDPICKDFQPRMHS